MSKELPPILTLEEFATLCREELKRRHEHEERKERREEKKSLEKRNLPENVIDLFNYKKN